MDWAFLGQLGSILCFGLGALGSSLGAWVAGQAAAGAWARDAKAGKPISFSYIIFIAAPLTQTLYAYFVVLAMQDALASQAALAGTHAGHFLAIGIAVGLGEMFSAWGQGAIGAAACRCLSEGEGKGFAFLVIAIGIIELVGILSFVLSLGMIPRV